jgi:hypothetical protein
MKIRTAEHLSDFLAEDFVWRKREMSALRLLADSTQRSPTERTSLLRALTTLLYAHWEGFIKTCARSYLEFVHNQHPKLRELNASLLAFVARGKLRSAAASDKIAQHLDLVRFFRAELGTTATIPYRNGVSTQANLSSRVLREICGTLGLEFSPFETKENLIDEALVESRNTIAHGEFLRIDRDRYHGLHEQVVGMMDSMKTLVENAAVLGQYRQTLAAS